MDFKEALLFRHACKVFDKTKDIKESDFDDILEAGRLAPSSMGMQPWEFWVLKDTELLQKVKKACWDQVQITTASKVVVIVAKISDLRADSSYTKLVISRRDDKDEEQKNAYIKRYGDMLAKNEGIKNSNIFAWSRANCYLAAENMMMQAAILGIDSCPMEGFVRENLENILSIDSEEKQVALVVAFGYRIDPQPAKIRHDMKDIVKYL